MIRKSGGKLRRNYSKKFGNILQNMIFNVAHYYKRKLEELLYMALSELIKYEGDNSTFIWKYPNEDFNNMTELIVHESQEAVFVAQSFI